MHTKGRFRNVLFDSSLHPGSAALAILVMLLFLLFILLFMTFAAQPVQGQTSAFAQNPVPPTARQAAAMPEFASRLAHQVAPQAAGKSRGVAPTRNHAPSPQDQVTYENGPANGTTDAWTINFGYVVSDTLHSSSGNVSGFDLWVWEFPGDLMTSVDWSITSAPNGGTVYGSGTASVTDTFISTNQYGYNIDKISASGLNVNAGGTVWLNLQNAVVPSGDPIYWDENSGVGCHSQGCPSQADESGVGTIPSEAFDIESNCYPNCPPQCFQNDPQVGFKIIHDFSGTEKSPSPGLAIDPTGKLYGTTGSGGDNGLGLGYKLAPSGEDWMFTPLYSFLGGAAGQNPGPDILGPEKELYGTADGGIQTCGSSGNAYCGVVYRLRPSPVACLTALCSWTETVVYRFIGDPDGWGPNGNLVVDPAGNLYGTTTGGGAHGLGTVYELTPSGGGWTEKVLYSFNAATDYGPPTSLFIGEDGNLYGTTSAQYFGPGVIFQLVPSGDSWTETVLVSFNGCNANYSACGPRLVQESSGGFLGLYQYSTYYCDFYGCWWTRFGRIFEMSPSGSGWQFSTLDDTYGNLTGCCDGYDIFENLIEDAAGTLYATEFHSTNGNTWERVTKIPIYSDSSYCVEDPTLICFGADWLRDMEVDASGALYGTTSVCGKYNDGTVWQLTPQQ